MRYIIVLVFCTILGYGYGTIQGIHDAGLWLKCTKLQTNKIKQCKMLYLDTWYRS